MHDIVNVAIIYYSSTGNVYRLARAAADAVEEDGANVRLRKVHERARPETINSNPDWAAHAEATRTSLKPRRTISSGPMWYCSARPRATATWRRS
jgi:hypothetical protein